jgi:hypothetical protein
MLKMLKSKNEWQQRQAAKDKRRLSLKRSGGNSIIGLVGLLPALETARLTENKKLNEKRRKK